MILLGFSTMTEEEAAVVLAKLKSGKRAYRTFTYISIYSGTDTSEDLLHYRSDTDDFVYIHEYSAYYTATESSETVMDEAATLQMLRGWSESGLMFLD